MKFTAVFMAVPEGYIGFVEELPGANTQGDTLEEARENLQEAVQMVLDANHSFDMTASGLSPFDERELGIERFWLGGKCSIRLLFSFTAVVALDLVAIIAPSAVVVSTTILGSSILLALFLRFRLGYDKGLTALIAFAVSMIHCAALASGQSIYSLTFFPDRAAQSFGLGNPLSAAIVGAVLGIPFAVISWLSSFLFAYVVVPQPSKRNRSPGSADCSRNG